MVHLALFKVFRGDETNLPASMNDGWAYFCTDTGNFYIDWDNGENLVRTQINSNYANKLRYMDDEELVEKINSNKDRLKISSLYSPIHMDLDSITFNQYTCQTQISKNKILFTDLDKIQVQFFISEFGKIVFNKMADRIKVDGVIVEPILRVFRQSEFDKAVYIKDKEIYEYKYKSKVPHGLYADIIVKYCFKY